MLNRSKFLEPEELKKLRARIAPLSCRDEVLIAFAVETGARAAEILGLTSKDLYPDTDAKALLKELIYGLEW